MNDSKPESNNPGITLPEHIDTQPSEPQAATTTNHSPQIANGADQSEVAASASSDAKVSPQKPEPLPQLELAGPNRLQGDVCLDCGQLLAPHGFFRFGGQVCDLTEEGKLEVIKPRRFCTKIEKFVSPVKNGDRGTERKSMSSGEAASVLLSEQFNEQLREVLRVHKVRHPVMREDGVVELLPGGYDRRSRILTVDTCPYATDVSLPVAINTFDRLFSEFPFADDGRSKAIALAGMISVFCLPLLPPKATVPVSMFRGNQPGLGKGLLAQLAMLPVLGFAPTGVAPKDETEMRKLLFATARDGSPVVFLDNVTGRLASPSLESFVTTSTVSGRVLGTSTSLNCKKQSAVFITGHHCTLNADMARRTLVSELFLAEPAGDREIANHLDETKILEQRAEILGALYALVREWNLADQPGPSVINPNFAVWSKVIGGIVEHAGFACVCDIQPAKNEPDARGENMTQLVEALFDTHRTEAVKFTTLIELARTRGLFPEILITQVGETTKVERTAMVRLLTSYDQRLFGSGMQFVSIGSGHARRYAVRRTGGESGAAAA